MDTTTINGYRKIVLRITSPLSRSRRYLTNDRWLKEVNKHAPSRSRYTTRIQRIVANRWKSGAILANENEERNVISVVGSARLSIPLVKIRNLLSLIDCTSVVCSKINSAIKPTCPLVSLFFVVRSRLRLTIRGVARERVHFYGRVWPRLRASWSGSVSSGEVLWMVLFVVSPAEESDVHGRSKVLP